MDSKAFVQLALETLTCSQKELAARLEVSPTQISKWKNGEHMSSEMEHKFRVIINIGDKSPEFVLLAGSLEAAEKWERLIHFLAQEADEEAETGYDTGPLSDDLGLLCPFTFDTLKRMGVDLPKTFPAELDIDYEEYSDDLWDLIHENPYSSLICKIYKSFTNVFGFYAAYILELDCDDELGLLETEAENIEPCLLDLAASKIDEEEVKGIATEFRSFRNRVKKDYGKWLNIVKGRAMRNGVPLRAELLDMVYKSHEELGEEAEQESLGFNATRLHPDIYMDELLRGMRIIHQVLPAIMKKLGIGEDEFQLDASVLQIDYSRSVAGSPLILFTCLLGYHWREKHDNGGERQLSPPTRQAPFSSSRLQKP
jgi:transcriptional regulator with XRE-family HTH domain